jgi:hypothetical protein
MKREAKISTGLNDRPRNETIGQTGEGIPDDSSSPPEAGDAEIAKVREKLGLAPAAAGETAPPPKGSA